MKKIFKLLSVLCIVLILSVQQVVAQDKSEKTVILTDEPKITFVGVGHSPLVEGDTENFIITTKCIFGTTKVQYRMFLHDDTRKTKVELTEGYSELVDHNIPYKINPSHIFEKGKYRLEIWVRAEISTNEYDSTYIANLNCVSRDNKNRVYTNGDMLLEKDTYNVGEKVVIQGIKDIGGITGPYKYRLHIFSPNKIGNAGFGFDNTGWAKNVTRYLDTIEWIPSEPGTYVLDVHAITPNSTLWKNVQANKDVIYGGYEAWKLKTITVVGEPLEPTRSENEIFIDKLYTTNSPYWNQGAKFINDKLNINYYDYTTGLNSWKTLPTSFNANINNQVLDIFKFLYTEKEGYKTEITYGLGEDKSGIGAVTFNGKDLTLRGGEFITVNLYTSSNATVTNKNVYAELIIPQCASEQFNNYKNIIEKPVSILIGETNTAIYEYIINEYKKCVIDNSYNITTSKQYDKVFGNNKVTIWSNGKRFVVQFIK